MSMSYLRKQLSRSLTQPSHALTRARSILTTPRNTLFLSQTSLRAFSNQVVAAEKKEEKVAVTIPPSRWQKADENYQKFKKEKPTSEEFLRFLLKNVGFATATYLAGYAINEYLTVRKKLSEISLSLQDQSAANTVLLGENRVLCAQPDLYLSARLTSQDTQHYDKTRTELVQQLDKLKRSHTELDELHKHLAWKPIYHKTALRKQIANLKNNITQQIEQLEIAQVFNTSVWLQKNHRYDQGLTAITGIIHKLETIKKEKRETIIFNIDRVLAAAYNTQAKLHACLGHTLPDSKQVEAHRDQSETAYDQALALLTEDTHPTERAILLNSKAYLLTDRKKPETALVLRQEANRLKPDDDDIIRGLGFDLHAIENQKSEEKQDSAQLNKAYGYFSRALQLNPKVPNNWVSRGKLQLDRNDLAGALADFNEALKLDNHHSEANMQKAYLLLRQGDCETAKYHFQTGITTLIDRPHIVEKHRTNFAQLQQRYAKCSTVDSNNFFKPLAPPSASTTSATAATSSRPCAELRS